MLFPDICYIPIVFFVLFFNSSFQNVHGNTVINHSAITNTNVNYPGRWNSESVLPQHRLQTR